MTSGRSLVVIALAALLAAPVAASAQTRSPTGTSGPNAAPAFGATWRFAGLAGFEFASGSTGFGLRGDAETDILRLAPNLMLSGVGSVGWTNWSDSAFGVSWSTNILKFVPAARFNLAVAPKFQAYGDTGLGLYYAHSGSTAFAASSSGAGVTMRFAVGGLYTVNDKVRIGAELGANPFFGELSSTTWNLMAQASFRM
jgi:hypothetical protein